MPVRGRRQRRRSGTAPTDRGLQADQQHATVLCTGAVSCSLLMMRRPTALPPFAAGSCRRSGRAAVVVTAVGWGMPLSQARSARELPGDHLRRAVGTCNAQNYLFEIRMQRRVAAAGAARCAATAARRAAAAGGALCGRCCSYEDPQSLALISGASRSPSATHRLRRSWERAVRLLSPLAAAAMV